MNLEKTKNQPVIFFFSLKLYLVLIFGIVFSSCSQISTYHHHEIATKNNVTNKDRRIIASDESNPEASLETSPHDQCEPLLNDQNFITVYDETSQIAKPYEICKLTEKYFSLLLNKPAVLKIEPPVAGETLQRTLIKVILRVNQSVDKTSKANREALYQVAGLRIRNFRFLINEIQIQNEKNQIKKENDHNQSNIMLPRKYIDINLEVEQK